MGYAKSPVEDFHSAVNDYLKVCRTEGIVPENAYKGSFNISISSKLHKKAVISTTSCDLTLNSFVESEIQKAVLTIN